MLGILECDQQLGGVTGHEPGHLFGIVGAHRGWQGDQGSAIVNGIYRPDIIRLEIENIGMQNGDVTCRPTVVIIDADDFRLEFVLLEEASYCELVELDTDDIQPLLLQPAQIETLATERDWPTSP